MGSWMFVLGLLLVSHLGVMSETDSNSLFCQFPDSGWRYHHQTKTCMKVFKSSKIFYNANNDCKKKNGDGHLVFILDNDTNTFVKELISNANVSTALIGLHDRGRNGHFTWRDPKPFNATFLDWESGEPKNDKHSASVVITKNGWREFGGKNQYVCQVDAVFPKPEVVCNPAEIGKESSPITCSLKASDLGKFKNVTISPPQGDVSFCTGSEPCESAYGYSTTYDDESQYKATLKINKVGRLHEGKYTCSYQFEGVPETVSNSCELNVYVAPDNLNCSYNFTDKGVNITCITDLVYPEGVCEWRYSGENLKSQPLQEGHSESSTRTITAYKYYKTTCSISKDISGTETHTFKLIMFPKGYNSTSHAAKHFDTNINMAIPKDPPILTAADGTNLSSVYGVTENDTVTITCTVKGGLPPVINTTLTCDNSNKIRDNSTVTEHGQSVRISFTATRDMDGKHCNCSANHLSGAYKKTTLIDFSVKYPATVKNFESSVSNPEAKSQVTLNCHASGNPPPTLKILAVKENGEQDTLVENTTNISSHKMTVSCRDSGKYVCRGRNDLNTEDSEKSLDLLVKCAPEHCDTEVKIPRSGAATNKNATIKLCVFGYPEPTRFILYLGLHPGDNAKTLERKRYEANFQYTNNKTAEGMITIAIRDVQHQDLRNYTLYTKSTDNHAYLPFVVEGKGPPSCPSEIQTMETYSDTVTLTWKPGFNGGPPQTFIVKHQKGDTIQEVKDTEEKIMSYNITGLTENSPYIFSIDVTNSEGLTKCPDVFVNVTTKALPISQDSSQTIYIIIAVVLIVILISIVVIIFLVKRRRKKKELKLSAEYKAREAGEGESLVRGDEIEDLYASADINTEIGVKSKDAKSEKKKKDKKKEDKEKKKDKVKKKEEKDQDTVEATYAVVNKMPKKDKKGAECKAGEAGEGGSLVRGDETEDLYANVDISTEKGVNKKDAKPEKKKKDKKKDDKEKKKDKVKKKEEEDQDTMEATYAVVNKMPKKDKKDTKTMKSATKSKEDKKKKEDKKGGGTEKPEDEVEVVIENDLYVKSSDLDNAEVVIENDLYAKSSDLGNAEVVIENDLYAKSSDLGNAEVVIENDLYAKSSDLDKAEVVIENDLYGKSSDLTTYSNVEMPAGAQPDPPDESVYANEIATSPPGQKLKSEEKEGKKGKKEEKKAEKDSGRTVNADGLVYVTVEINPKTKKPEAKSDVPATGGATQPSKPKSKYDPVEYVLLDHTAKVNAEGKEEGSA